MLCQMADSYDYPWMLRLDADELISHSLLDEMEYLPQEHTVLFNYISLYPDENSFITGNHPYSTLTVQPKIYPKGRVCFPRPFDMSPEIFQHRYTFADSLLYHFHMVDKARRLRRYKTYLRDDPEKIRGGPERPYEKKVKKYQHIVDIEEARHLPISLQKVKTTSQLIDHLESMDELRLIEEKDVENLVSTLKQRVGMVHLKDRFYLPSI